MSLRREALWAVVLGTLSCQPSLNTPSGGQAPVPARIETAVFDPARGALPLPNDLALRSFGPPAGLPQNALDDFKALLLLTYGGFPPDQSGVTLTFTSSMIDPQTRIASPGPAPDLDLSSLGPTTVAIVRTDTGELLQVDRAASSYAIDPANPSVGTLTLLPTIDSATGSRRWPQGAQMAVAVRGGVQGLKTRAGDPIGASQTLQLLLSPVALTDPTIRNSAIIQQVLAQGGEAGLGRLEGLRQLYSSPVSWGRCPDATNTLCQLDSWTPLTSTKAGVLSAYSAVDKVFPHGELASIQTFTVGTLPGTWVDIDSAAGKVPLPSDLIRLPGLVYSDGTPSPTGRAFGALAQGLATLDGFSTTGMLMAPTSGPVAAASIQGGSVLLFDLTDPDRPVLLQDALAPGPAPQILTQPPPITLDAATNRPCTLPYGPTCGSLLVGLQPAALLPGPVALPPLKEATRYALVITKQVKDVQSRELVRGTVARLLFDFPHQLTVNGKSTLPTLTDSQAQGMEEMRQLLMAKVFPRVPGGREAVAMAYTFRTQTITGKGNVSDPSAPKGALQLATLPYAIPEFPAAPVALRSLTVTDAGRKYGLPAGAGRILDPSAISSLVEANLVTFDLLDPATGAFLPDATRGKPHAIPALLVVPNPTPTQAPLVIFRHGINQGRADVLPLATALAKAGMVVAAIDADKFGDRAWCQVDGECAQGTCVADPALAHQGDGPSTTPGFCKLADGSEGQLAYRPVVPACTQASGCWDGTGGKSTASGNYFVSSNFFRTRDSMRQDVIDQAALVRALVGSAGQAALRNAIGAPNFGLDATRVYFVGQSLGAIQGTVDVAVNPLFSRAVLNVGGGAVVDVFTSSPAFKTKTDALLASLGIAPGTAAYLQFMYVTKWVLDPADPINFASALSSDPLPNLLASPTGSVTQTAKGVLGQAARCDNVVPNSANQLLYGLIGLAPLGPTGGPGSPALQWFMNDTTEPCPTNGSVGAGGATHGFLLDFANSSLTTKAQGEVAGFLATGSLLLSTPVTASP